MTNAQTLKAVRDHAQWLATPEALIQRSAVLHSRVALLAPACTLAQRARIHSELALVATALDEYEEAVVKAAEGITALRAKQMRARPRPKQLTAGGTR